MATLTQFQVPLPPELERFVKGLVDTGAYATSSEVVLDGLRLLQERAQEDEAAHAALKAKLQRASDQADRGEFIDGKEAFARLDAIIHRHQLAQKP